MELLGPYTQPLLTLAALHLAAAMSPGPSVILVAHAAAYRSRRAGLAAAAAMGVGAGVWATAALFGLDVLLTKNPIIFHALQLLGSAFLVWTGAGMVASARKPLTAANGPGSASPGVFSNALKLQLSNPKVVIFFSSIFLAALPAQTPISIRLLLLAVILVDETLWYSVLAVALSTQAAQKQFIQWKAKISTVCGCLLAIGGVRLLWGALS